MNKGYYHRKLLAKSSKIGSRTSEYRKLLFATGHAFYPQARRSLPIYTLDKAVEMEGLEWRDEGRIMRVETPKATFIKPLIWEEGFLGPLIREGMERSGSRSTSNLTVITHSNQVPIGSVKNGSGDVDEEEFPLLKHIARQLQSDNFQWTIIGVGPKTGTMKEYLLQETPTTVLRADILEFHELYDSCRVPFSDWETVEEVLHRLADSWVEHYFRDDQ